MDAAVTVFANRGIEAASISEITATAGVSHGIFYYHFRSKTELLDAVGHAVAAALVNEVDDAISDVDNGVERVALATQEFISRAAAEPEWGWLIVEALGDLGNFTIRYPGKFARTSQSASPKVSCRRAWPDLLFASAAFRSKRRAPRAVAASQSA